MSSQYNNSEAGSSTQPKGSISNLTRNLLSSSNQQIGIPLNQDELSAEGLQLRKGSGSHAASYNASHASSFNRGNSDLKFSQSIDYQNNYNDPNSHFSNFSYPNQPSFIYRNSGDPQYIPANNDNMNYIPSGHNTPTVVSSSYSSTNSYTPMVSSGNTFGIQTQPQNSSAAASLRPVGLISTGQPTTNISIESVNTANQSLSSSSINSSRIPHPGSFTNSNYGFDGSKSFPHQSQPQTNTYGSFPPPQPTNLSTVLAQNSVFQAQQPNAYNNQHTQFFQEPDHYMTYKEFLQNLKKDTSEEDGDDDEHLNIVDYPVNDLILMLSCLLTKIIEANDKLHPNHFDNTIAVRQRLKEEKKNKRLEKLKQKHASIDSNIDPDDLSNDDDNEDDEDDDDDDDEIKNKYLANVLAFHGTNVPGISLHAYLARVLKYCPVTNEVFLSLLVYFDRIAKKANNLKQSKGNDDQQDQELEAEQLFVMDSYNIHRLIISGITVSSKFFSDIFYKNLRYAKVGGLPLDELNYLELQFLLLLDFKLMISVEDLQNYGDLLLRFWKREQVTNELVNSSQSPSQMDG